MRRIKKVVLQGATLIPGIRVQGWDVAIGPAGPIVIEINNGSGYTAPQLATGRGFLSAEFRRFLEQAEAANETYPWKDFFKRQEHGHRFGRSKGVLKLIRNLFLPGPGNEATTRNSPGYWLRWRRPGLFSGPESRPKIFKKCINWINSRQRPCPI